MKIGILSMQKILNYGSFLQALSLKIQLEKRGHEVYFIDIKPGRRIVTESSSRTSLLSKFDKYFLKRIENYFFTKKMDAIHKNDYVTFLETSKKIGENEKFDLVIIGSDEVFNATTPSNWGFSTQLFGEVDNAQKIVTYAASCGNTTYENAVQYKIADEIKKAMSNINMLSVRDKNTYMFVKSILGVEPYINVDPVFLTNFDTYVPKMDVGKPYLLVYAYNNRIKDPKEINSINSYARKNGLKVLSVGMHQRWCPHNIAANAFSLLRYVESAKCIVTDTFHGTVFSIKYNKNFAVLIRDSNSNKLGGLLEQFSLQNRIVETAEQLENVLNTRIDYKPINKLIAIEQRKASDYLDAACEV